MPSYRLLCESHFKFPRWLILCLVRAKLMAGYSATPLWKKLGYKDGITAYVEGVSEN